MVGRRLPRGRGRPRAGGAGEARPAPDAGAASVPPPLGAHLRRGGTRPSRLVSRIEGDFVGEGIWSISPDGRRHPRGAGVERRGAQAPRPAADAVLRPVFAWNHRWAMARGLERITALARRASGVAQTGETGPQAVAPVRQLRGALLAAEDRDRRPRRLRAELRRRDPPHPAVEPGLLEDRLREVGPRAVAGRREMPDPERGAAVDQRARRLGEVARRRSGTRAGRPPPPPRRAPLRAAASCGRSCGPSRRRATTSGRSTPAPPRPPRRAASSGRRRRGGPARPTRGTGSPSSRRRRSRSRTRRAARRAPRRAPSRRRSRRPPPAGRPPRRRRSSTPPRGARDRAPTGAAAPRGGRPTPSGRARGARPLRTPARARGRAGRPRP